MANSFDPTAPIELADGDRQLLARRTAVIGAPVRLFYQRPVHFVRGEGVLLYDSEGLDYLDVYNNVPVVGHSNARVRHAVDRQLGELNTHTRYLTDGVVEYAERLTALFPAPLSQVIYACSGSEAADLALRIARTVTGKSGVIVTRHAYHGTTTATAQISPSLGPGNPIPADVALVDAPDQVRDDPATALRQFGERVDRAVAELGSRGVEVAAIVLDSVLSSDGLQVEPRGILDVAAERARAHGCLFVADEVQAGFGRTGRWWGFQRHHVRPDLVILGKPMGNGLPIAALVGSPEIFDAFGARVRYFNTFGGNPVCVAAANAVMDVLQEDALLAHAEALGAELHRELVALTSDDPGVAAVRGAGLFLAIEFTDAAGAPDEARAHRVVNALRERRVLISASGTYGNALKIRPPLVFPATAVPRLLDALSTALETR